MPLPAPPSSDLINADEVLIWTVATESIEAQGLVGDCERLLSAQESARYARFLAPGARLEYLVGRALVRTALAAVMRVGATELAFTANAHGRPELAPPWAASRLRFNLSHSGGLVACAVARGREVGIDVEDMQRRANLLGLAERCFSPRELAELSSTPLAAQPAFFFAHWTLKEAYAKARGIGIGIPFTELDFSVGPDGVAAVFGPTIGDAPERWLFTHRAKVAGHHCMSLALATDGGPPPRLRLRAWDEEQAR